MNNRNTLNKLLAPFLFMLLFIWFNTSCQKPELNNIGIREIGTMDNLFGMENAKHLIGVDKYEDMIYYDGLIVSAIPGMLRGVTINHNSNYELSNGIQIGSSKKEILQKMGKPTRDKVKLLKGPVEIGSINILVYDNICLFLDSQDRATSITMSIGEKE